MFNKKVYFYSAVIPSTTGSGAAVRVYTNIRAYTDIDYEVELILFVNDLNKNLILKDLPGSIKLTIVEINSNKSKTSEKFSYIIGFPKQALLNYLYPIRKSVSNEIKKRLKYDKTGLHHLEYVDVASSMVGLKGVFFWSNHDLNPERYLSIKGTRIKLEPEHGHIYKRFKYFQLKRSEKWIARQSKIVFNISETESRVYKKRIKNINSNLLPFSWPNEQFIEKRNWSEPGKLKMLHLGSLNSMIPFSSLEYIINRLFKIIPNDYHKKIELIVAGHNPNAPYSNYIKKIAKQYKNIKFLGYVESLDNLFADSDIQIVASQFESGLRTRIVESFVRGLPVISTNSGSRGLYGLENGDNILLGKMRLNYLK